MKKILIIAAHPDDEVLGCFGTVAKLIAEGHEAYTLILGEGKTSREQTSNHKSELELLENEINSANNSIGIKKIYREYFPDNQFDTIPLLTIVKAISKVKDEIKPDIIFTHYSADLNVDHQITYQAVITATRPMENEATKEIYSFEILSSTEWNYPLSFPPDIFFDISETLDFKIAAMEMYESELCQYPHPRSLDGIKLNAKYHGMRIGKLYAEAFKCVRIIR